MKFGVNLEQHLDQPRATSDAAAETLLAQIHGTVTRFAFEQRVAGALRAHEAFDSVLAAHVDALDDVSRMLRGSLRYSSVEVRAQAEKAVTRLDKELAYLRTLQGGGDE